MYKYHFCVRVLSVVIKLLLSIYRTYFTSVLKHLILLYLIKELYIFILTVIQFFQCELVYVEPEKPVYLYSRATSESAACSATLCYSDHRSGFHIIHATVSQIVTELVAAVGFSPAIDRSYLTITLC